MKGRVQVSPMTSRPRFVAEQRQQQLTLAMLEELNQDGRQTLQPGSTRILVTHIPQEEIVAGRERAAQLECRLSQLRPAIGRLRTQREIVGHQTVEEGL